MTTQDTRHTTAPTSRKVHLVPTFNAATGKIELCEWIHTTYAVEPNDGEETVRQRADHRRAS
jgi:hypothetical protein